MVRDAESPRAPAFFLDPEAREPALLAEEAEHARKVLRLGPGAAIEGLDGRGRAWPLEITRLERRSLALEARGEPRVEPAPGEPGAPLPWIEVAAAWPRRNRVEDMLDRATQLGAAAILPLEAEHRGPEPVPADPPERWRRVLRTACKQSRRLWLPELEGPRSPADLVREKRAGALAILDPGGGMSLDTWLRSLPASDAGPGTRERPIVLVIGPEGGFSPAERDQALQAGATTVRLGPHVLRIETAVTAALAVAACALERAPWPRP